MAEQERRSGRQEIEFYVNDQPVKTDEEELTVERILERAGEASGDTAEGEKLLIELREGQRVEHANPSERIHIKANSRFEVRSRKAPGPDEEEPATARGGGGREGQPRGGQGGGGRPDVPREGTREYERTVGQPSARTGNVAQQGQGIQRTGSEGQERGQVKPGETPLGPGGRERTPQPTSGGHEKFGGTPASKSAGQPNVAEQTPGAQGERRGTSAGMAPGTTGQGGQTGTAGQQGLERRSEVTSTEGAGQQRVGEREKGKESSVEDDEKRKQKHPNR